MSKLYAKEVFHYTHIHVNNANHDLTEALENLLGSPVMVEHKNVGLLSTISANEGRKVCLYVKLSTESLKQHPEVFFSLDNVDCIELCDGYVNLIINQ